MYQTISDISKTINLQQYIDNKDGNKRIGLKVIRYNLCWFNVYQDFIKIGKDKPIRIDDGYYSFQELTVELKKKQITLRVNEATGISSLRSVEHVRLSTDLTKMLGFKNRTKFDAKKIYYSTEIVDLAIHKSLFIYLEQISTSYNYLDGKPSTLLAVVPVENKEFGEIISIKFDTPEYKFLIKDIITELKLEIRDENNKKIINHLPVTCVLEIIS